MKRIAGLPAVALEIFVFLLRFLATGLNHVENLFMVEYLKTTPVVFYKKKKKNGGKRTLIAPTDI